MRMRIVCLLLAILMLAGCSALAEEDSVLFTFMGREYRQSEIVRRAEAYAQAGLISSGTAYEEAISYMHLNQLVPEAKAAELGLDQYTEEELAEIREEADRYFEAQLDAYIDYFAPDMTDAEKAGFREELRSYWAEMGTTVESAEETHLFNRTRARLMETMEITVTDEEIRQVFEEQTAKDEAYFRDNYRAYEYYTYYRQSDIWYVPEGYRAVLDLRFSADTADALTENAEAIGAARDALGEGVPFEQLTGPGGETPREIWVHEESTLYSDALEAVVFSEDMREPGSVSEAFQDEDGAHILCALGEVPSGPVAFDERIEESIRNYLTSRKQDEILHSWAEEYPIERNQPAIDALMASVNG
ncbi:MAG: hypothetical protein IJH78_04910 [Clostridia bacterium]|nr:hypothetical protein [Clostridia bacterium]